MSDLCHGIDLMGCNEISRGVACWCFVPFESESMKTIVESCVWIKDNGKKKELTYFKDIKFYRPYFASGFEICYLSKKIIFHYSRCLLVRNFSDNLCSCDLTYFCS